MSLKVIKKNLYIYLYNIQLYTILIYNIVYIVKAAYYHAKPEEVIPVIILSYEDWNVLCS